MSVPTIEGGIGGVTTAKVLQSQVSKTFREALDSVDLSKIVSPKEQVLLDDIADLWGLVEYAATVSPEFNKILVGYRVKKRIG